MPKVSVILPCYNVEKYICTCLDSLLNQTLRDIEIICVDDKSPDNVLEILHQYAKRDSRIRVIELPENAGVSVARNTGIDAATGEYISFVDPDDYVDLDYFEKLYKKAIKTGADICVSNIKEYMYDGKIRKHNSYVRRVCESKYHFNYIQCAAIFKLNFINKNNLRVPVGITNGEDTLFCIKCAVSCNFVVSVPKAYYHYIRHTDSAEQPFYTEKQINCKITVARTILNFINSIELPYEAYKLYFRRALNTLLVTNMAKTTLTGLHKLSAEVALEIYHKSKFANIIKPDDIFYPYLQCNDADGLRQCAEQSVALPYKIKINLLRKIPFITIKQTLKRKKIRLFGITIFYVKSDKE